MTDSAGSDSLRAALLNQGQRLHQHEQLLATLSAGMQQLQVQQGDLLSSMGNLEVSLSSQLKQLRERNPVSSDPVSDASPPRASSGPEGPQPEPRLSTHEPQGIQIERYDGDSSTCRSFLVNCSILFELNPSSYSSERAKVAAMMSHLTGRAREWATAEWDRQSASLHRLGFTGFPGYKDRQLGYLRDGGSAPRDRDRFPSRDGTTSQRAEIFKGLLFLFLVPHLPPVFQKSRCSWDELVSLLRNASDESEKEGVFIVVNLDISWPTAQ
ncbi:hypothetical protein LDENG_00150570 [Lucifuga dentata]|nr:hypothetical protein LDENG_00150570 [Lucifuga dentata]